MGRDGENWHRIAPSPRLPVALLSPRRSSLVSPPLVAVTVTQASSNARG